MSEGMLYIGSGLWLTLLVAFVVSVLEDGFCGALVKNTARRWGKFLLGLVILAAIVQVLSSIA